MSGNTTKTETSNYADGAPSQNALDSNNKLKKQELSIGEQPTIPAIPCPIFGTCRDCGKC